MRISDWSSDVCSSDLRVVVPWPCRYSLEYGPGWTLVQMISAPKAARADVLHPGMVGRETAHAPPSPYRQSACERERYAAWAAQRSYVGWPACEAPRQSGSMKKLSVAAKLETGGAIAGIWGRQRSERRRVGKECVRTCSSRW